MSLIVSREHSKYQYSLVFENVDHAVMLFACHSGYMAPEYAMCGQYSIKSDVFSFGVLVLEIITGRRNSGSYNSDDDIDLINLVSIEDFSEAPKCII